MSSLDKIFPDESHPKGRDLVMDRDFVGNVLNLLKNTDSGSEREIPCEVIPGTREEWQVSSEFTLGDGAVFSYLYSMNPLRNTNPGDSERVLKNGEHFQDELGNVPNHAYPLQADQNYFTDLSAYVTWEMKSKATLMLTFNGSDGTFKKSQVDANGQYDRTPSGKIIELYDCNEDGIVGRIEWDWYTLNPDKSIRGIMQKIRFLYRERKRNRAGSKTS